MTSTENIPPWRTCLRRIAAVICLTLATLGSFAQEENNTGGEQRHLVEGKETFYSLSRKFNVSISDLKDANPGMEYPKAGEYIVIPSLMETGPESVQEEASAAVLKDPPVRSDCRKDKHNLAETYRVALMIPLSLEEVPLMDTLLVRSPSEAMNLPSFRFIQFYQGFLMAADTLASLGLHLDLTVIDSDQDQSKTTRAISSGRLENMDLIVGPFYKNAFTETAEYASQHGIPIVNPLSAREDIIEGYPNVFKMLPSRKSQPKVLATLAEKQFESDHIFIVTENAVRGAEVVQDLAAQLSAAVHRNIPVIDFASDSLPAIRRMIRENEKNLVILYSETGVLPVQLLPHLHEMGKETEITIVGMPEWEKFEHLENRYLISLKAYLFSDSFVDYNDPMVKEFVNGFRMKYMAEPLPYAFSGYDMAFFFLSSMMDYGRDFSKCLRNAGYPLLNTRYIFDQIPGGGFDNQYWNVYYFQDYYLVRVPYTLKWND